MNKRHNRAAAPIGVSGIFFPPVGAMLAEAGNVTLTTVVAPTVPGVTVGGLNVAVAPDGNPDTDIVTVPLNVPPTGGTAIVICAVLPDAADTGAAGPVSE